MFGSIIGAVGGGLVSGLTGSNGGGGLMDGLGDIAGKLLDPLGIFSSGEETAAQSEGSSEMQEMMDMMMEMLQEMMGMLDDMQAEDGETTSTSDSETSETGLPTSISTGSGDDVVTIGASGVSY